MTAEETKRLNSIFTRFGSPSREAELRVTQYLVKAEDITSKDRIAAYDKNVSDTIKQCESMIETLKLYRIALA